MASTLRTLGNFTRPLCSPYKRYSSTSPLIYPHISYSLGSGSQIRFCMDKWASDQPLNVLFLRIFSLSTKKPMSSLFSSLIQIGISTLGMASMISKLRNYPPSSSSYPHFVYSPLGRIPPGGPPPPISMSLLFYPFFRPTLSLLSVTLPFGSQSSLPRSKASLGSCLA